MQTVIIDRFAAFIPGTGYRPIRGDQATGVHPPPGDIEPLPFGVNYRDRGPVADGPLSLRHVVRAYATHWRYAYTVAELARRLGISRITLTKYLAEDDAARKELKDHA